MPKLSSEASIAAFGRGYLGYRFASTKQAVAMTTRFVKAMEAFIQKEGLEPAGSEVLAPGLVLGEPGIQGTKA